MHSVFDHSQSPLVSFWRNILTHFRTFEKREINIFDASTSFNKSGLVSQFEILNAFHRRSNWANNGTFSIHSFLFESYSNCRSCTHATSKSLLCRWIIPYKANSKFKYIHQLKWIRLWKNILMVLQHRVFC